MLIDDNPADARLMAEGIRIIENKPSLAVAHDADEALSLLLNQSRDNLPDLILLDINLPKRDGLDLLQIIRRTPEIAAIPVLMLSSSSNPREVYRAYAYGANAYITKPVSNFFDMLGDLERFWLKRAVLPNLNYREN